MQFVDLKSEEQLDMQTLHRVRDQLVGERTSLMNHSEPAPGTRPCHPSGRAGLAARLAEPLGAPTSTKPARINRPIVDMCERWIALDQRISELDPDFAAQANGDELAQRPSDQFRVLGL